MRDAGHWNRWLLVREEVYIPRGIIFNTIKRKYRRLVTRAPICLHVLFNATGRGSAVIEQDKEVMLGMAAVSSLVPCTLFLIYSRFDVGNHGQYDA